jgi:hypothetical protein
MKKLTIGCIFALAVIGVPAISSAIGLEPVPVAEPTTALLLAAGGVGVAALTKKKRQ